MTYLVARIDHALTRGINWLTTCLVERGRGFNSTEAGDFLAAPGPNIHGYRLDYPGIPEFVSVQMPDGSLRTERYPQPADASAADLERHRSRIADIYDAVRTVTQSPAASAGRGESSSSEVSAGPSPTAPSGERADDEFIPCGTSFPGMSGVMCTGAHRHIGSHVTNLYWPRTNPSTDAASETFPQYRSTQK